MHIHQVRISREIITPDAIEESFAAKDLPRMRHEEFKQIEFFAGQRNRASGALHTPPFTVLFLGGSQGSKAINDCVVSSLALLSAEAGRLRIVHQTGQRDYEAVKEAYGAKGVSAEICPFIEDVPDAFARADLVVSRSGALTVAELAAAGKASLLIPFPAAADRHQLENAEALQRAGAARVIEQAALTPERLVEEIRSLLAQPEQLAKMEERARSLARPDAAARIADLIEGLAR